MAIDHITNHVTRAQALVVSQYKGKPRLAAWIASYCNEVQALEDAIYDVLIKRLVDVAVGAQQDAIGRIVDELRQGRTDAVYKLYLLARIRIHRSQGHPKDFVEVLAIIESALYDFDEYQPATVVIEFRQIPTQDPNDITAMMRDTKSGGIQLHVITPTDANDFLLSDEADADDPNHSFSDEVTPDGQGLLSAVYL